MCYIIALACGPQIDFMFGPLRENVWEALFCCYKAACSSSTLLTAEQAATLTAVIMHQARAFYSFLQQSAHSSFSHS